LRSKTDDTNRLSRAALKFRSPAASRRRGLSKNWKSALSLKITGALVAHQMFFDDFAVAFNDQFRGVTLVKHAEAWF
jgi:hypothetical protein